MRIVIVEDEKPAADRLELLLRRYDPDIEVVHRLDSVQSSIAWFKQQGTSADLVFMDIRLTDGLSFELFRQVSINKPVITDEDCNITRSFREEEIKDDEFYLRNGYTR